MLNHLEVSNRPALMPEDTPDYMAPAWASFMGWAIGKDEIRAAFEAETGMQFKVPKCPLERMIDEATGHGEDYVKAFIQWANKSVWGDMSAETDDAE